MSAAPSDAAGSASRENASRDTAGRNTTGRERAGRETAGWTLRGLLALAVAGLVAAALAGGSGTGALTGIGVVMIGLAVVTVGAPGSPAATFLVIAAIGVHLMLDSADLDAGVVLLTILIPLVHQLSGICAVIPAVSRVSLAALRPAALRFAGAVGVVLIGVLVFALVR